jgi:hypothetical protein
MRTTLSLDDDVAALIERLRAERGTGLKTLVNQALRQGLRELEGRPRPAERYRTPGVDLGRCRLASLDDVASALAAGEGEGFR